MPWVSIIMFIVTYFISSKSGASKGKSALVAGAAALGTYYLADPANTENVLGIGDNAGAKAIPGDPNSAVGTTATTSTGVLDSLAKVGSTAVTTVGDVAKSWGPVGTIGAVAAGGALSTTSSKNWIWIAAAAAGALLLLK